MDVRKEQNDKVTLPFPQKTFHVEYTEPETGHVYGGDFTVKRLTMGDIRQVAIRKAQLNGGVAEDALDRNVRYVNSMLAHLEIALTQKPEWWKPDTFYNADVIAEIYSEVISFEESFRHVISKQPEIIEKTGEVQPQG